MNTLFAAPADIFDATLTELLTHFTTHQKTYLAILSAAPISTAKTTATTCLERLNALAAAGNAFRALDLNLPPGSQLKIQNDSMYFLIDNQIFKVFKVHDFNFEYSLFYHARFHYCALMHALKSL